MAIIGNIPYFQTNPLEITHNDAEIMGNYASKSENTVQETCKAESPAP